MGRSWTTSPPPWLPLKFLRQWLHLSVAPVRQPWLSGSDSAPAPSVILSWGRKQWLPVVVHLWAANPPPFALPAIPAPGKSSLYSIPSIDIPGKGSIFLTGPRGPLWTLVTSGPVTQSTWSAFSHKKPLLRQKPPSQSSCVFSSQPTTEF